jgi:hypothetical protein
MNGTFNCRSEDQRAKVVHVMNFKNVFMREHIIMHLYVPIYILLSWEVVLYVEVFIACQLQKCSSKKVFFN